MTALSISNIPVRQDDYSRFCLNDLHKASGGKKQHQPSNWLRNQQTIDLIGYLKSEESTDAITPTHTKQGVGTFAVKELVYAYAMWISAKFHITVIRAYDSLVNNTIPKESKTKQSKKGCLTKDQQDTIKNIVRSTAEALPKNKRASTTIKMWSAIKNKFGCSYKDVDESEFNNIVSLLARLPIEGELLPPPVNALDSMIPKTEAIQTLEGLIYRSTKEHFPIRTFISIQNGKAVFVKQLSVSEIIFDVDKMDDLFSSIETLKKDEGISLGRIASSQAKR